MNLFEHQKKALATLPNNYGLFWEPGLGKSLGSIFLASNRLMPYETVLIITTKSLKTNWRKELDKFYSEYNLGPINWSIHSKEEFRKHYKTMSKVDCIIIDEAHYFATITSQLHKAAAWYIGTHKPKCIWLLTGTPILSSVMSVWGLSRLMGRTLGSFQSFRAKYFHQVAMGGRAIYLQRKGIEKQIAQELKKIGDVVSKEEALDLPDTLHDVEYFSLTKQQQTAINKLVEDPTVVTPIVYHTKCLQISNGTLKINDNEYQEIECMKLERIKELVDKYPSCVIVARQTAELEMLNKHIKNSYIFNGKTSPEERDQIINKVNSGDGIMLLQADMGIGFNLQGVNTMIFYSHTWDYVKYSQCLSRTHRAGQLRTCLYIHLITEKTIDEATWECLNRKESFNIELYSQTKI